MDKLDYVIYVIVKPGLLMETGKICTQVVHGVIASVRHSSREQLENWYNIGDKVICLKPNKLQQYEKLKAILIEKELSFFPIIEHNLQICFAVQICSHEFIYNVFKGIPLL